MCMWWWPPPGGTAPLSTMRPSRGPPHDLTRTLRRGCRPAVILLEHRATENPTVVNQIRFREASSNQRERAGRASSR